MKNATKAFLETMAQASVKKHTVKAILLGKKTGELDGIFQSCWCRKLSGVKEDQLINQLEERRKSKLVNM